MPFAYLRDPLFLFCFFTYWVHRWLAGHDMSTPLLQSHLNDLICIPFWVPIMLWIERRLGLRRHDHPPDAIEITIPLVILAAAFEAVIPSRSEWHVPTVPDPKDVLAYCIGSLAGVTIWQWYYRAKNGTGKDDKGDSRI
jgi:hypothetical protein